MRFAISSKKKIAKPIIRGSNKREAQDKPLQPAFWPKTPSQNPICRAHYARSWHSRDARIANFENLRLPREMFKWQSPSRWDHTRFFQAAFALATPGARSGVSLQAVLQYGLSDWQSYHAARCIQTDITAANPKVRSNFSKPLNWLL